MKFDISCYYTNDNVLELACGYKFTSWKKFPELLLYKNDSALTNQYRIMLHSKNSKLLFSPSRPRSECESVRTFAASGLHLFSWRERKPSE